MTEGKWHNEVRVNRIKEYKNKGFEVKSSHGDGKISLYLGKKSRSTFLSDADIVLLKKGEVVMIEEIQSTLSPKQATGIITATSLCDRCKIYNDIYELSNIFLNIAYKKQKEKSKKPEQLQLIKENLKMNGCLSDFNFEVVNE